MAAISINASGISSERIYLTANTTLTILDGVDAQMLTLIVTEDAVGGHSLTFANASSTPSITTAAKATTIMQLVYDAVTNVWNVPATAIGGNFSVATLALTSAQILALNGTPVQIVAAPGAGKLLVPIFATFEYKFNSLAYANVTSSAIVIAPSGLLGTTDEPIQAPAEGFIDQTASQFAMFPGNSVTGALTAYSNAALLVANEEGSGEFTTGDGTLIITLWYTTLALS